MQENSQVCRSLVGTIFHRPPQDLSPQLLEFLRLSSTGSRYCGERAEKVRAELLCGKSADSEQTLKSGTAR